MQGCSHQLSCHQSTACAGDQPILSLIQPAHKEQRPLLSGEIPKDGSLHACNDGSASSPLQPGQDRRPHAASLAPRPHFPIGPILPGVHPREGRSPAQRQIPEQQLSTTSGAPIEGHLSGPKALRPKRKLPAGWATGAENDFDWRSQTSDRIMEPLQGQSSSVRRHEESNPQLPDPTDGTDCVTEEQDHAETGEDQLRQGSNPFITKKSLLKQQVGILLEIRMAVVFQWQHSRIAMALTGCRCMNAYVEAQALHKTELTRDLWRQGPQTLLFHYVMLVRTSSIQSQVKYSASIMDSKV